MQSQLQTTPVSNPTNEVLKLLATVNKDVDLLHELQTEIDPNVYIRRNSVNLLIGKKGSGKTYNVFREVLKLKWVPNHRYTKMIYVTNKPYDPTYSRIKDLMPIPVEKIPYEKAVEAINQVAEAKKAMTVINNEKVDINELEDESKQMISKTLGEDITKYNEVFHTIVLLDDCAFLFEKHTRENRDLWKLLFENRQPKITYFLTMQDPKGMDSSLKEALDTVWLFGGFTKHKFSYLLQAIPHESDVYDLWCIYQSLTKNQALIFFNTETGTEYGVLKQ